MDLISRRAMIATAIAILLQPTPASARRRIRISGRGLTGRKTYTLPNVLKPEELRVCLQREAAINSLGEQLDADEVFLQQNQVQLDQTGRNLDAMNARVDVYSSASVNAYNREVERHRRMVADYNRQLPKFNARAEAFNNQIQEFNGACANKSYYEDDMQTARAALESKP